MVKIFWDKWFKSRARKLKIFFNLGECILRLVFQILHSGAFQTTKIKNFLQPWWRYSAISDSSPSFWGTPDHENQKNFNLGEYVLRYAFQILYFGAFQTTKIKNVLQPWWRYSAISGSSPSCWRVPDHENEKFSSTLVNIFWDKQSKSSILEHSRPRKSKIFFNHGEDILR